MSRHSYCQECPRTHWRSSAHLRVRTIESNAYCHPTSVSDSTYWASLDDKMDRLLDRLAEAMGRRGLQSGRVQQTAGGDSEPD
eukprot:4151062-Amphidinium_carterae.1